MVASLIKTLLVLQLVVAQLAAPLVHAHVGGEAEAGKLHLPGLESWSRQPQQPVTQADDMVRELPGLAVGIATGLQIKQVHALPASQPALIVPLAVAGSVVAVSPQAPPRTRFSPLHVQPRLEQAAPRAPPTHPTV